jgi:hypothetical protein
MSLFWDKFCRSRPVEHNLTTILPPHAGSRTRDSTPICKRNVGSLNRSTFDSGLCTQDGSHGLCRGWTPFPEHYQHRVPVDPCSPCWGAKCWRKGVKERLVRAFPLSWFSTSLSFEEHVRAVRASLSRQALRQAVRGHILEVGRGSSPTFEGCLRWVFAKVPQTQCRCQGYSGYGSTVVYRPTQLFFRIQMDSDQLFWACDFERFGAIPI